MIPPIHSMDRNGRHTKNPPLSLSQRAYETIRQKIISLELTPGAVIDEACLIDELGLGRTPIREALQRLSQENLVTIVPRRGTFVTEIGITDLQRLFEMRLVLESMAARLATQRGTAEHWQRMTAVLSSVHTPTPDNLTLITIDEACHLIIYEAAGNKFLLDTMTRLFALGLRLWYYFLPGIGGMEAAVLEHHNILIAMQTGDADLAAELMVKHISAFQEKIQSIISHPVISTQ